MATYLRSRYNEILKNLPAAAKETAAWFKDAINIVSGRAFMARNRQRLKPARGMSNQMIGRLVMYTYDPKLKYKLPYYDRFPLVIIVKKLNNGWHGINLHYLPPNMRVDLLDGLKRLYDDKHLDENARLRLSYEQLTSNPSLRFFRPAFKRYLADHVRSNIYIVDPMEWDLTILLPTEKFTSRQNRRLRTTSKYNVWRDSRKIVRGS